MAGYQICSLQVLVTEPHLFSQVQTSFEEIRLLMKQRNEHVLQFNSLQSESLERKPSSFNVQERSKLPSDPSKHPWLKYRFEKKNKYWWYPQNKLNNLSLLKIPEGNWGCPWLLFEDFISDGKQQNTFPGNSGRIESGNKLEKEFFLDKRKKRNNMKNIQRR